MAAAVITTNKLTANGIAEMKAADFIAVDATDGAVVAIGNDQRVLIVAQNSNASAAKAVTVVKGDGIQAAGADLSLSIPANGYAFVTVESGVYGQVSGTYRGKIQLKGASTDIKVAAYRLP